MPLRYVIDDEHRLVATTGHGIVTDQEIFEYKQSVWSLARVAGYDELLDMRDVHRLDIPSTERIRELVRLSAAMDVRTPSRVAIVANDLVTHGIARIYSVMRRQDPRSTREISVFKAVEEAVEWLKPPGGKRLERRKRAERGPAPGPRAERGPATDPTKHN